MSQAPTITVTTDRTHALRKGWADLKRLHVVVGIPQQAGSRDGGDENNAVIGYKQEYGEPARGVPPRPFLNPSLDKKKGQIADFLKDRAVGVSTGKETAEQCYTAVGLLAQSIVKEYIRESSNFKPLSARTLAARKARGVSRTKPLIDTGQLLNSISFDIRATDG
jgi:hypothetical protein